MHYRLLPIEEWPKLQTLMEERFIPSPEVASAAVAEADDGTLQGVLFMQLAVHVEPLVLTTPSVSFKALFEVLQNSVADKKGLHYYAFSESDIVDGMARRVGLQPTPYRVWRGEV